jgi:hypothetical protein
MVTPDALVETRESLHRLAEHVLAPARYVHTGRIGLRATEGGFGTPSIPLPDGRRVRVAVRGAELVVWDGPAERVESISTLRAAAAFVGVEPGAPADVYRPVTPLELDRALVIDAEAAQLIAAWFALGNEALESLRRRWPDEEPAEVQLWPEHFDLATTISEVNYGASPGDAEHTEPYLYVGPWTVPSGSFWNEPFGASRTQAQIPDLAAAEAFFLEGRAQDGAARG